MPELEEVEPPMPDEEAEPPGVPVPDSVESPQAEAAAAPPTPAQNPISTKYFFRIGAHAFTVNQECRRPKALKAALWCYRCPRLASLLQQKMIKTPAANH